MHADQMLQLGVLPVMSPLPVGARFPGMDFTPCNITLLVSGQCSQDLTQVSTYQNIHVMRHIPTCQPIEYIPKLLVIQPVHVTIQTNHPV